MPMGRGSRYLLAKSFMEGFNRMRPTYQHVSHPRLRENSFLWSLLTDVTVFLLAVTQKSLGLSPDPYGMSFHPSYHHTVYIQADFFLQSQQRVPLVFLPLIFKNSRLIGPGASQDSFPLDFIFLIEDLDYICKIPLMLSDMMSSCDHPHPREGDYTRGQVTRVISVLCHPPRAFFRLT